MTRTLIAAAIVFGLGFPGSAGIAQTSGALTGRSGSEVSRPASPDDIRSPMQEEAMVPNMAPITTLCGRNNAVTMKDEFGRQYNCRGDRVR